MMCSVKAMHALLEEFILSAKKNILLNSKEFVVVPNLWTLWRFIHLPTRLSCTAALIAVTAAVIEPPGYPMMTMYIRADRTLMIV
jgi:hypothetical protein